MRTGPEPSSVKSGPLGGPKAAADVVNTLTGGTGSELLEVIRERDSALAENIEELMFVFENLLELDGKSIQALLPEVPAESLLVALKGSTAELQDAIFSNMSKRAADLLREDLEATGPIRLVDVEAAQREILSIARRLMEQGNISYGGGDGYV